MNKLELAGLIIVCILIGVVLCIALGTQGIAPFDGFYSTIHNWITGADLTAISNPTSILAIGGSAASIAGLAGVAINGLKSKVTAAQTQVQALGDKLSTTSDQLNLNQETTDSLTAKLADTDKLIASKDQALSTVQTQATAYKEQLDKLTNRYNELSRLTSADVIGSLPGGTTITKPDGSTVTVIEKTVVQ